MKGQFLEKLPPPDIQDNIYSDKCSLILDWILRFGLDREQFSVNEIVQNRGVSVGLIRKVLKILVSQGILEAIGIGKSKRFILKKPGLLLDNWLAYYSIEQCKMRAYKTAFPTLHEIVNTLEHSNLKDKVVLGLHSAAERYKTKFTNIETLEFYLLDLSAKHSLEKLLRLEPQERGYKILMIEPRYKYLLRDNMEKLKSGEIAVAPALLTFLDLYHFPVRGIEQAEYMAWRLPELDRIYKRGS